MRINLKKLLNEEFEKITPDLSVKLKSVPISTVRGGKSFNHRILFRLALIATVLVIGISVFCVSNAFKGVVGRSDITCVITCDVQIVVEKGSVIDVKALSDDSKQVLDGVNYDDCDVCELIERIIEKGLSLGYIDNFDSVTIEAVNNNSTVAKNYLKTIESGVTLHSVSINTRTLSMSEYNQRVFGVNNVVDNLDEDRLLVIGR
ncbi:MAG: hypothetical protein ACI4M6_00465 [Christensenellaceae bacterium]